MRNLILILSILSTTLAFGQGTGTPYANYTSSGPLGTAAATIDIHTTISIYQTTPGITLTIPQPTNLVGAKNITINNGGTAEFLIIPGGYVPPGGSIILRWSGIWQLSGVGNPGKHDSLNKVFATTNTGYGKFRYLQVSDLPDSITQDKILGLEPWEDSIENEVASKADTGMVQDVWQQFQQGIGQFAHAAFVYSKTEADTTFMKIHEFSERDSVFIKSLAHGITANDTSKWDSAYKWGNHSGLYPLVSTVYTKSQSDSRFLQSFSESDPTFSSSAAFGITSGTIGNWNAAYGWGNHAGIYEPVFSKNTAFNLPFGTASNTVAQGNDSRIQNGQTAFSWGNHAGLYEPTFFKNTAFNVNFGASSGTAAQGNDSRITNGQTAFGWGDHSVAGYFKPTITSPITGNTIRFNGISWVNYTLTKTDVGLASVDNTSDANKPVSTAQQAAINSVAAGKVAYASYHALISQSGGANPTVSRKDTSFSGVTFTWVRTGAGVYTITASSAVFAAGKTAVFMGLESAPMQKFAATITSSTVITINTNLQTVGLISLAATLLSNGVDGMLNNTLIEIRVYN